MVDGRRRPQDVREKVAAGPLRFPRRRSRSRCIQRFNPDDQPIVSVAVLSDVAQRRRASSPPSADQVIIKRIADGARRRTRHASPAA